MTESWDKYAAEWDDNEAVITYSKKAFASLCEIAELDGLRIFDFGCGTGLLSEQMAKHAERIVALDPSVKMAAVLKRKNLQNVDALVGEITDETLQSRADFVSSFDLVVASSVCAFLPDYRLTLGLLKRLLKPRGLLIQWDWLKSGEDQESGFTESEVATEFERVGLRVLSISTPFSLDGESGGMKVVMGVGMSNQLLNTDGMKRRYFVAPPHAAG